MRDTKEERLRDGSCASLPARRSSVGRREEVAGPLFISQYSRQAEPFAQRPLGGQTTDHEEKQVRAVPQIDLGGARLAQARLGDQIGERVDLIEVDARAAGRFGEALE